jgi:hypothetical protein
MDVVTESVMEVYEQREEVQGLKFTYEPELLRFFQARFELVRSIHHHAEGVFTARAGATSPR